MSPSISTGQTIRMVSGLEWAMMEDIGWNVVPEPAAILLFGLGAFGLRTKKRYQ